MSTLSKIQAVCVVLMLIGLVWLTVDVFGPIEPNSLQAAAIVCWAGLLGNAVCIFIRLWQKNR